MKEVIRNLWKKYQWCAQFVPNFCGVGWPLLQKGHIQVKSFISNALQ